MIKIINNDKELIVTKGAYENIYKRLGYEIARDIEPIAKEAVIKEAIVKEAKVSENNVNKKPNDKKYR